MHTMISAPTWADPAQITDPADRAAGMRRSPIRVERFGSGQVRTVIVDDGDGPRLHLDARTEDGLSLDQATALVAFLTEQVGVLEQAAAE